MPCATESPTNRLTNKLKHSKSSSPGVKGRGGGGGGAGREKGTRKVISTKNQSQQKLWTFIECTLPFRGGSTKTGVLQFIFFHFFLLSDVSCILHWKKKKKKKENYMDFLLPLLRHEFKCKTCRTMNGNRKWELGPKKQRQNSKPNTHAWRQKQQKHNWNWNEI